MTDTVQDRVREGTTATERLRASGLRVTGPRLAVLDVLAENPHADVATVLELTRERASGLSVQGVYDVLTALTRAGLLNRVQPGHSAARYELNRGDNHHHVVCRGCQAITDVPCTSGRPPCLDASPAETMGFTVDEAEVIFWGVCPSCQQSPDGSGPKRSGPTPEKKEQE